MLPDASQFDHLRFDPTLGIVIREPPGTGYGNWVGGHKVSYDPVTKQYILFYRERTPLEKGRGGHCALAVSDDGISFNDVWRASKEEFAASSIEVGHCVRGLEGKLMFYVSYEVAGAGYWRVDLIEGDTIENLSVQSRRTVLQPHGFGLRSIKDPVVYVMDSEYLVYVVSNSRTGPSSDGDVLTVGGGDATLLAKSYDGRYFTSMKYVFEPPNTDTWHGRRARINSTIRQDNGWLATYCGGRNFYDTYEEWCGLAWSPDGARFERLEQTEPWVRSPYGCIRYVYAQDAGDRVLFYYEYTRRDGSHDLRVSPVRVER